MIDDKDLKPGQLRLLETDNHAIPPIGTTIRLQITFRPMRCRGG